MWCVDCSTAWDYITSIISSASFGKPRKTSCCARFLQSNVLDVACKTQDTPGLIHLVKAPSLVAPSCLRPTGVYTPGCDLPATSAHIYYQCCN